MTQERRPEAAPADRGGSVATLPDDRAVAFAEHARRYAQLGWALARADGKRPVGKGWHTTQPDPDPEHVAGLWGTWGRRWNMGVVLGPSSLCVVEADTEDAERELFAELLGGELPETPVAETGAGRHHVYFTDNGHRHATRAGLELRADAHLMILPPSEHPETGAPYRWLVPPWEVDLAPVPEAILTYFDAALRPNGLAPPVGDELLPGFRHKSLVSLAGTMRRRGMGEAEILAALRETNRLRCKPPLGAAEVEELARDVAARYAPAVRVRRGAAADDGARPELEEEPGHPRTLLDELLEPGPPRPLPLHALPRELRRLSEEAAAAIHCPPDQIGVPALVVCAAMVGSARALRIKHGWNERPTFYLAIVGDPGGGKSPALSLATAPLRTLQSELGEEYRQARAAYERALGEHELAEGEWRKQRKAVLGAARPVAPAEPRRKIAFSSDATWEALAAAHLENLRGLVYLADELSGWARSMGQYKSGRGADRQHWLSAWSAGPITILRRTLPEPIVIPRPALSVLGGLPPDVLGELADEQGREDGFIHRILFTWPEWRPTRWSDDVVSDATRGEYETLARRLRSELQPQPDGQARLVGLTPEASAALRSFLERELHPALNAAPVALRGPLAKLVSYTSRLALVIHLCEHVQGRAPSPDVGAEAVEAAAELVRYFASHTARVYQRLRATPRDRHVAALVEWTRRRGGSVTLREIVRAEVGGVRTAAAAESLCNEAAKRELGALEDETTIAGRRKRRFRLAQGPDTRQFGPSPVAERDYVSGETPDTVPTGEAKTALVSGQRRVVEPTGEPA